MQGRPVALVIALGVVFGTLVSQQAQSPGSVRIAFTAPETISQGEPIVVTFRIQNDSDRPVPFDVGEDRVTQFYLSRPDPIRGSTGSYLKALSAAPAVFADARVPARGSYAQQIVLTEWLQNRTPGTDTITLAFHGRLDLGGATLTGSRSTTITIRVVPKDAARLEQTCARLAAAANANTQWDARIAAYALATVRDPAAIPHLTAVARKGHWPYIAIWGLERIGTAEAWSAIEKLLAEGRQADLVDYAAAALARSPTYDAKRAVADALVAAKRDGKHVLLNFGAIWCLECRLLDQAFGDPGVAAFLKQNFVVVTVHVGMMVGQNYAELNVDLVEKYGVFATRASAGIPGIVVLDAAGRVLARTDQGEWRKAAAVTPANVLNDLRRWAPKR